MNTHLPTVASPQAPSPYIALPGGDVGDMPGRPKRHAIELSALIDAVLRRKMLVIACAIGGALLGLLVFLSTKPEYRASVILEVNAPTVEILNEKSDVGQAPASSFDFIATQVGLLKSRSLAERVAQELRLGADPSFSGSAGSLADRTAAAAGRVQGGLDVEAPQVGQLITLSYTSDTPQRAAQVANGIADGFINSTLQRRYDASNYARDFLQKQIVKTRGALEESERKLVAYQQSQGLINTSTAEGQSADVASLQGGSLVAMNEALAAATTRRMQAQAEYENGRLAAQADASNSSAGLRATLAGLQAEYQEKRNTLKPDHPEMVALQARIDELQRQIGKESAVAAGGKVASLLAAYRAAQAAENRLRGQVSSLKGQVLDQRGRSIQYNILQRDVDTNRGLYDALLQRYKEVGVGSGIGKSPVSIVDRADVPGGPFRPNLRTNLLAGLIAGLLGGAALAAILGLLHDVIRTRDDVRDKLGRTCIGVIPKEKNQSTLLEDFNDPQSSVSEAYSAVLAALRFSSENGAPKAMLLTSANPAEGKSSSALALAQSQARRGERVLLIDADLRRPVFKGNSNEKGLINLLTGEGQIRDHVIRTEIENLWLLPCGAIAPNPADLLSTPRMAEIVAQAAQGFDRVVIDGPPLVGLADAALLAEAVGHVLMVVESGKTRRVPALEALDRIDRTSAHLVGVLLTKSSDEASRYGYGSYRYYAPIKDDKRATILITQRGDVDQDETEEA